MIFDADTWIGHWPFRALPHTTAADLISQMDRLGIEKALTANLHGLFYKDAHEANHELHHETYDCRGRIIPCALINPLYSGWRDDLRQCREEFGMPLLRLAPDYHGYQLHDACASELTHAALELEMRVALCWRLVDSRGRHRLDPGRETDPGACAALLRQFPDASFLMLNFPRIIGGISPEEPCCLYDIPLFSGANGYRLEQAVAKHGADRFVFGSSLLLRYGSPALITLEKTPLSPEERDAIAFSNLTRFLP